MGRAHAVGSGAPVDAEDYEGELRRILAHGLRLTRAGGGGALTRFVCGYLTCDLHMGKALLGSLPPVFKVDVRADGTGRWLEQAIRHAIAEAPAAPAGGEAVLARLAESLFIETLRRYLTALPDTQTGWLAGARDRYVGKALALLHRDPASGWTLDRLARSAGLSRSALNERFRHYLGDTPMAYLAQWRLQLGARLLQSSTRSIAAIAAEVGYESEPAFNRAFRRTFGEPPGRYRKQARQA